MLEEEGEDWEEEQEGGLVQAEKGEEEGEEEDRERVLAEDWVHLMVAGDGDQDEEEPEGRNVDAQDRSEKQSPSQVVLVSQASSEEGREGSQPAQDEEEEEHHEVSSHTGRRVEHLQAWLGHREISVLLALSEGQREAVESQTRPSGMCVLTVAISCRKNLMHVMICSRAPLREMLRSLEFGIGSVKILMLQPDL